MARAAEGRDGGVSRDLQGARAVTTRSVAVSAAVIAASVLWDEWMGYYSSGSNISRSHFPMAFFFPYLAACTSNLLVDRLFPGRGLSRQEMRVVLGTGLVGVLAAYDGITGHLISILAAPYYFASPENGWDLYLHEHIPHWLVPSNASGEMTWFFEGVPAGSSPALGVWVAPLFWWTTLLAAVGFAMYCTVVVVRKRWVDHERLAYPLVEVGQLLADTGRDGRLSAVLRSPLFWLAFALVMGLKLWNVASYFSPAFPWISIEGRYWKAFPDFPYLITRISFYGIGFGYFAQLDVLFSVWFFFVLTAFEVYVFNRVGYSVGAADRQWRSEALGWQSAGALMFLALWGLWMARRHLAVVWHDALSRGGGHRSQGELISYRTAVFGLGASLVVSACWLCAAGMEPWASVVFLVVMVLTFLGLSRVVAELGLVYVYYRVHPYDAVLQAFGTPMLSPSSVTLLGFMRVFQSASKGYLMPSFAQAVKAVDGSARPRRVSAFIWIALGFAFAVSVADTLYLGYEYGAYNLGNLGLRKMGPGALRSAVTAIRNPSPLGGSGRVLWAGIGAALMAILTLVRYRAPWWPLHPIGLAVQGNYGVTKTWISTFIAWAFKWILVHMGGPQLYERGKPFFVGLLIAQAVSTMMVFWVDWIWFPFRGHNVHNY